MWLIPSDSDRTQSAPIMYLSTGLALIHQGERIIPAAQNAAGAIAGNTVVNAPITIYGYDKSPDQLAREILAPLSKYLGRRI